MKQLLFVGILVGVALRAIAGDITKNSLDKEFSEKLSAFYHSEEFTKTPPYDLPVQIGKIAHAVYSSHAAVLFEAAKKKFYDLPTISLGDIPKLKKIQELPISELLKVEEAKLSREEVIGKVLQSSGGIGYRNNVDPAGASVMAVFFAVGQFESASDFKSKRGILSGFARDVFYRINGDPTHPKIAVDSLGEWFIIDLEWEASGLYLPSRIEWRRDAQIKQ